MVEESDEGAPAPEGTPGAYSSGVGCWVATRTTVNVMHALKWLPEL